MGSRLQGKVAIITGGSRGLGEFCAVAYGREGATVAVAARTETAADERFPGTIYDTAEEVTAAGGEGFPVVCNVADMESVSSMVDKVLERYGRIDIVMNNAAIWPPGTLSTMKPRHWELVVRVNINGALFTTQAVRETMVKQGSGSIINISSHAADSPGPTCYGVTKRSLEALTVGMAEDLGQYGIAVNALKPVGGIDTPGIRYSGGLAEDHLRSLPPPDRYQEAAVLLALKTPQTGTGLVVDDAEAVDRWASEPLRSELLALPMR